MTSPRVGFVVLGDDGCFVTEESGVSSFGVAGLAGVIESEGGDDVCVVSGGGDNRWFEDSLDAND